MLYYIKYFNHEIEKLQQLLIFFFDQVKSSNPTVFDRSTLLPPWYNSATSKITSLEKYLEDFLSFSYSLQLKIINAFEEANNIEVFFSDANKNIPIVKDFESETEYWKIIDKNGKKYKLTIADYLDELFNKLYDDQLSKKKGSTAPFPKIINSDIYDHYLGLKKENEDYRIADFKVCPFCGIENLRMTDSEGRPDYDHILPKGDYLYAFSAINLKNLIFIGSTCNTLKLTRNLLYEDEQRTIRTIAFYPFESSTDPFELIDIKLVCNREPEFSKKGNWTVNIVPLNALDLSLTKKIATWNRVFNIQNRYAEYIERDYNWIKNLIRGITIENEIKRKIDQQFLSGLKISYSVVATDEGIILKKIFWNWFFSNSTLLSSFITLNNSQIANLRVSVDDCI